MESAAVHDVGDRRFTSAPASSRRDLSPAGPSAYRERRGSRSPSGVTGGASRGQRSRRADTADRFRERGATWRSRRESSSSSRSPDGSTSSGGPPAGRRQARRQSPGRVPGGWRRRPRSAGDERRAYRSSGAQGEARDSPGRDPTGGGGRSAWSPENAVGRSSAGPAGASAI